MLLLGVLILGSKMGYTVVIDPACCLKTMNINERVLNEGTVELVNIMLQ
jgi:hypothetical protein